MPHTLVPSDRVEHAPVCGHDGAKIGVIERLMLDKTSGNVAYAVVKCAAAFAQTPAHCPLPWSALKYSPRFKAYESDLTLQEMYERAAEFGGDAIDWGERGPGHRHPNYWTV